MVYSGPPSALSVGARWSDADVQDGESGMSNTRHDKIISRVQVDYYTIELAPLVDGTVSVSVSATFVKGDQIENETIDARNVATIEDALSFIGRAVSKTIRGPQAKKRHEVAVHC